MRVTSRVVILLAVIASLISYAKFNFCAQSGWQSPGQYIHACYSDIPALYGDRALDKGVWAYSSGKDSVEYPVIQGSIMWLTAKFIPHGINNYFYGSALLLALLFIFIATITLKIKPEFGYLLPLAPAAIASLYINWDLWAIATMLLAIYWFDRKAEIASAIALGIAVSTKFLPIFLLIPIAIIFFRQGSVSKLCKYLSVLCLMIGVTALVIFLLQMRNIPTLAHTAIFIMVIVMAVSKVYSPQYVLWLTPLAIIALIDKRELAIFWFWQGAEVLYHVAIWQHLATVTGAKFGLSLTAYSVI